MKLKTKLIAAAGGMVLLLTGITAAYGWHRNQMNTLRTELTMESEKAQKMDAAISELKAKRAALEIDNQAKDEQIRNQGKKIEAFQQNVEDLKKQIDDLLFEEVVEFDVEAFTEEIQSISELATVEYRYTNIGLMDESKKFSFIDWKKPFSEKLLIVSMDGIIKAGTDLSKVKIDCDEDKKVITISLPEPTILSNELNEDSFEAHEEKDSVWNRLTLDDSAELRVQIKEKAQQNAIDNKVLEEAGSRAQQLIQKLIEALPNVREQYQIEFRKAI